MWNLPSNAKRRVVNDGGTGAGSGMTVPVDSCGRLADDASAGGPPDDGDTGAPAAIQARMISFSCPFSGPAFAPFAGMSSSRISVQRYDFSGSRGTTHSG